MRAHALADVCRCVGGCLNASDVVELQANDTFDIDGYCPRLGCVGGNQSAGECLSDDTAATLTQVPRPPPSRYGG